MKNLVIVDIEEDKRKKFELLLKAFKLGRKGRNLNLTIAILNMLEKDIKK